MTCPHNSQRPEAKFCDQCGAELPVTLEPLTDEELMKVGMAASGGHPSTIEQYHLFVRAVVNAHDARLAEILRAKGEVEGWVSDVVLSKHAARTTRPTENE